MSAISDIFDAFNTTVSTALTSHKELDNPYFLEKDSQITLAQAYGVKMGPGENLLGNENSGQEQRQREVGLVLTRRKFATRGDITERKSVEKQLFEDLTLVLDAVAQDPKLGLSSVQRFLYSVDTGVQFLQLSDGRNDIYFLEATFLLEYEQEVQLCV